MKIQVDRQTQEIRGRQTTKTQLGRHKLEGRDRRILKTQVGRQSQESRFRQTKTGRQKVGKQRRHR